MIILIIVQPWWMRGCGIKLLTFFAPQLIAMGHHRGPH